MAEESGLKIDLSSSSVVNRMTGEIVTPAEHLDALQELEREVTRCDDSIESLKEAMRGAKEAREHAISALRSRIREAVAKDVNLPLFDRIERVEVPPDTPMVFGADEDPDE